MADTDLPNAFGAIKSGPRASTAPGMAPADWWRYLPPFVASPQALAPQQPGLPPGYTLDGPAPAQGGWQPAPLPMVSATAGGWEPAPVPMTPNTDTSAAAGRAILERSDPRFAPAGNDWGKMDPNAPADNDSWWKMAPNAPQQYQRTTAFDDLIPPQNKRGPWDDYSSSTPSAQGGNYFDRFDPKPNPADATNAGGASMNKTTARPSGFDVQAAKTAGYSDAEIADYLGKRGGFDVAGARKAGYSNAEILQHLAGDGGAFEERTPMQTATRLGTAGLQGVNRGLYSAAMLLPDLSGVISQRLGLVPHGTPLPSETLSPNGTRFDIKPDTTAERVVNDVGNAVGQVAGTAGPAGLALRGAATPLVAGARVATPTYGQTVAKTLASQPGMQLTANAAGNVTSDLTENPYLGLAASLAVPFGANAALRVPFSAPAKTGAEVERRALLADSKKEGILPSFGNIVDSGPAKMFESVVSKLPFMGNAQAKLNEGNKIGFNVAAFDKVPALKGEGIDAATPGNIESGFKRISDQFNNLTNNTTLHVDPQFGADIAAAKANFSKQLADQMPAAVSNKLDELATAATAYTQGAKPQVDGRTYQNIRSKLGQQLSTARGTDRDAIGSMIDALDGMAERSLPKDTMQDFRDARQSWRRLSMIDEAVSARHNGETAVGNIPPGSLDARAGSDKDMARLAQIGVKYVGDKTPDSGTATRLLMQNLLGLGAGAGGAYHFPMTTAALAAGGILTNAMLNNPYTRAALIARLQNSRQGVVNRGLVATLAGQQGTHDGQ